MIRHREKPSKDRLQRIANMPSYSPNNESSAFVDDSTVLGATSLCVDDPIATTVICEKRFFSCIGQVITIESDTRSIQMISSELLPEPTVTVTFRILQLREVAGADSSSSWQWNGRYDGAYSIPGRLVEPVDPTVLVAEAGRSTFSFETEDLRTLSVAMFDKLAKSDVVHLPKVKRTDAFPYRTGEYACFACEKEGHDTTDTLGERFCPRCDPPVELNWNDAPRVLEHMAGHLLFDRALDTSQDLCGFCLRPAPQCLFYLRKGKGADSGMQVDFRSSKSRGCERARPFKYAFASKSTAHSPCSNVPIICPRCPAGQPAVWRYNFAAHCRRVHPSAALSDYADIHLLSASEKEGMRRIWDSRKASRRVSRKAGPPELKISDAHRAVVSLSPSDRDELTMLSDDEQESEQENPEEYSSTSDSESESGMGADDPSDAELGTEGDSHLQEHVSEPLEEPAPAPAQNRQDGTRAETPPDDAIDAPAITEAEEPQGRGCRRTAKRFLARDACICGKQVTDDEVAARSNVIECATRGCESRWYHMDCHNFTSRPLGWKCDSCDDRAKATKRRRVRK